MARLNARERRLGKIRACAVAIERFDAFEAAMDTLRGALECVDPPLAPVRANVALTTALHTCCIARSFVTDFPGLFLIERSSISHITPPLSESRGSADRAHACTGARCSG